MAMKRKNVVAELLLCFILSALVLTSCGGGESSEGDSSGEVSKEESSENVSVEASKRDDEETEIKEISESESEVSEDILENAPYKDSEIFPAENEKIIFGDDFPMSNYPTIKESIGLTPNFEEYFAKSDLYNDSEGMEEYYYVCLDFRRERQEKTEDELSCYFEDIGIKTEKIGEYVYVSYATKKTLRATKKFFSEADRGARCVVYLADKSLDKDLYQKMLEGYIPFKSEDDLSLLPPENSTVLYGKGVVPSSVTANYVNFGRLELFGDEIKAYFDNPEYDGAYYYFCFDTRVSYSPWFTAEEEIAYYASRGIKCEKFQDVLFAYATEEQIKALEKDKGLAPYCQAIWVPEDAKEKYKAELDFIKELNGSVSNAE